MMQKKVQKLLLTPVLGLGLLLLVGSILTLLAGPVPAARADTPIYVRIDGSDSDCNGEADAPATAAPNCAVRTIPQGIDLVDTGGTVNVAAGTYNQKFVISKSLTLQGVPGATMSIDQGTICADVNAHNVTIDGMIFSNCYIAILAEVDRDEGDPLGFTNLHLTNNTIYNTAWFGIYLGEAGEQFDDPGDQLNDFGGLQVTNNTVYGTGQAALVLQGM